MALPGISRFANRVALVTGASAGIGAAICEKLVQNGLVVVGCARNDEPIKVKAAQIAESGGVTGTGKLVAYSCDIGQDDQVRAMFQWVKVNYGGVDVCINNAGIAVREPLLQSDADKIRNMLNLNFVGLVMCTKYTIDSLKERDLHDGHVIQISSVMGHKMRNVRHCYAATKSAVNAISEGFRRELAEQGSRIRVSTISPGMTETNFHYAHYDPDKVKEIYGSNPVLQPQDVANAVLHVLSQPPGVQIQDIIMEATGAKP